MDRNEQGFRELLDGAVTRRLSRRQVMARAAALGLSAAAVRTLDLAAAPGSGQRELAASMQNGTPTPGGTLRVGLQADPSALDPHKDSLTAIWHVVEHIYSRLTWIDANLAVQPEAAETWEVSEDGLTFTFKLRPGIVFHDGTPLKASDVKFSFDRLKDPATASTSAAELASVESIEAPDDATVVLHLSTPDASLLSILAGASCIIMSEAFVKANNNDVGQTALGSGPFVFKEYIPNSSISLEKNPNYYVEGQPYVDALEMIIAAEDTTRTTALVQGTVDFIEYAPLLQLDLIQENPDLVLAGDTNTNIRFIGFNLRKAPFDNVQVRQAISMVVDREPMIASAVAGYGEATTTLFPANFWAALPKEIPPVDIEGAKALLAEAGHPDGFSCTVTSWSEYSFLSNAALVLVEQLRQIGIEAELNLVDTATMSEQVYKTFEFDIAVTGESAYVDPSQLILSNFASGESGNFVGYSNAQVDQWIVEANSITDQAQRATLYQQIQEQMLVDLPWINLFVANQFEAMKSNVKGYVHIPTGSNFALRQTWLEQS